MAGRTKEGEKGGTYSKDGQRSPVHAIHTFAPRIRDLAPRYGLAYCPTLSSAAAFTTRVQVALEEGCHHARDGQALQVHHIRLVRLERRPEDAHVSILRSLCFTTGMAKVCTDGNGEGGERMRV